MELKSFKNLLIAFILIISNLTYASLVESRIKRNQINIAIKTLPVELDPLKIKEGHHVIVTQAIFQTLVRAGNNGEITPSIAKRWDYSDEGKKIVFTIADTVFHTGEKVKVEDIIYSISRHMWPNSKSLDREVLRGLIQGGEVNQKSIPSGITKINDSQLSITLNKPYPGLLALLSIANMSIISKAEHKKEHYIGSGPYKIIKNQEYFELTRNDRFNIEKVPLKKLQIFQFKNVEKAKKLLEDDLIDLVYWGVDLDIEDKSINNNFDTITMDSPVFLHLFLNSKKGIFNNQDTRKLFSQLLFHFAQNSKHKQETREPIPYIIPKGLLPLPYYERDFKSISPGEFKKKVKSDEIYKIYSTGNIFKKEFYQELTTFLQSAGLKFEIKILERSDYTKKLLQTKEGDLIFGIYGADFPDIDGIIPPILGTGGWSYGDIDHKKMIEDVNKVKFIANPLNRLKGYSDLMTKFENEKLVFPMFRDRVKILMRKNLSIPKPNYRYESELWRIFWQ